MKEFLANIRPPKYLRYLFYIGYNWYRSFKSEKEDAHATTIVLLWAVHFFMISKLLSLMFGAFLYSLNQYLAVLPVVFITGYVFYILFWFRDKWRIYIEEFNHLKRKDRLRGSIYLFIYLFICLFIGFYNLFI